MQKIHPHKQILFKANQKNQKSADSNFQRACEKKGTCVVITEAKTEAEAQRANNNTDKNIIERNNNVRITSNREHADKNTC